MIQLHNSYLVTFALFILLSSIYFSEENEDIEQVSTQEWNNLIQGSDSPWPMGVVPFFINPDSYDSIIAKRIRVTMQMIERASCVLFKELDVRPRPVDPGWLHIMNPTNERDCAHALTRGVDGELILVLGFDCMQQTDILHSLLHVLGFNDEVTHPQRDQYVRIMWENIQPKYRSLFQINTDVTPYKTLVEYDTLSVMHFHDRAFSLNGGATIATSIPGLTINPSNRLSQLDVMKLRLTFGQECNKRKINKLFDTCKNAMRAAALPSNAPAFRADIDLDIIKNDENNTNNHKRNDFNNNYHNSNDDNSSDDVTENDDIDRETESEESSLNSQND